MKNLQLINFVITLALFASCTGNDEVINGEFRFISDYTATVTVGGFVGVTDRTFYKGETYEGTDKGNATIRIRIAEHTERNEDCPNSWCYQEHLEVPRKLLQRLD